MTAHRNTALMPRTAPGPEAGQHLLPPVLRLPGDGSSGQAPVRIFLGTEDAQFVAERVFIYSVLETRDPARDYEIHLMKRLTGFSQRFWRTGFTNYRFAIPDFAGGQGRAIYNDVDQVYTRDPAELFDLEMGDHGYLAVSPEDTSVMLIDCARMQRWWNRRRAGRLHKHLLLKSAMRVPGLWGPLDGGWNARDLEYVEGSSGLLHFTALHTQPWRPAPEQYSYHPNPVGEVWFRLKRAADAKGFEAWSPENPSADFVRLPQDQRTALLTPGPRITLDDRLDQVPTSDVGWLLRHRLRHAGGRLEVAVRAGADPLSHGVHPRHRLQRDARWWREALLDAASGCPDTAWRLSVHGASAPVLRLRSRPVTATGGFEPRRLCLLRDSEAHNTHAARAVAEALVGAHGWQECEQAESVSGDTEILLACGRRSSALLSRARQKLPKARCLHLGAPEAALSAFDLVIARPQDTLPLRDNVLALSRPLPPFDTGLAQSGEAQVRAAIAGFSAPPLLLLIGGAALRGEDAARLARAALQDAAADGPSRPGGVLAVALPEVPEAALAATDAVLAGHPDHVALWRESPDAGSEPTAPDARAEQTRAQAAAACQLAETVLVGDHCPIALAAAVSARTDGRVRLVRLPEAALPPAYTPAARRLRALLRDSTTGSSYRGTPRQQDWRSRLFDRAHTAGWLGRLEDVQALSRQCLLQGLASEVGKDAEAVAQAPRAPQPAVLLREAVQRLLAYEVD